MFFCVIEPSEMIQKNVSRPFMFYFAKFNTIMKLSYVYILKCSDNSYYTGVTSKLTKRLFEHTSGKYIGGYTYNRRPVELV